MEKVPSSLPDANIQLASLQESSAKQRSKTNHKRHFDEGKSEAYHKENYLFHEITLTSALCALKEAAGDFPKRTSHIAIFPSTEQEANTSCSVGLHCMGNGWKGIVTTIN